MTNEERDALIASARKTPWLDTMKRRETEALLEALDDAEKRVRDIEDLRARIVSAMSCEPDDDSDLVEAVRENVRERDDAERERDAARAQLDKATRERDSARRTLDRMAEESHTFNAILETTQRDLAEARSQRAALYEVGARYIKTLGDGEWIALAHALDDADTAAREYEARVRAPVEAERDQLAAALAEVMTPRGIYDAWSLNRVLRRLADAADHLLNDHSCDRHGYEGVVCARDAARDHAAAIEKLSIPADLAAQREARIRADERAKALRDARERIERHDAAAYTAQGGCMEYWREGRESAAETLRAMADEAERGTR